MTTTTVLATTLAYTDPPAEISIVLVNVGSVQPDGLSTTTCVVTVGGFTYKVNIAYAMMIGAIENATIGTTV